MTGFPSCHLHYMVTDKATSCEIRCGEGEKCASEFSPRCAPLCSRCVLCWRRKTLLCWWYKIHMYIGMQPQFVAVDTLHNYIHFAPHSVTINQSTRRTDSCTKESRGLLCLIRLPWDATIHWTISCSDNLNCIPGSRAVAECNKLRSGRLIVPCDAVCLPVHKFIEC